MTPEQYHVGDKVRLLKDIWDDGQDHHPPGYLARQGEILIVRGVRNRKVLPLSVSHKEITDNSFVVELDEVEKL